jgi:hypothetical protein
VLASGLWREVRSGSPRDALTRAAALVTAPIVVAPWGVYLLVHGGQQDSSLALTALRNAGVEIGNIGTANVVKYAGLFMARAVVPPVIGTIPQMVAILAAVGLLAAYGLFASRGARDLAADTAGLVGGVVVLFALYALVLGGTRTWYDLYADLAMIAVVVPCALAGAAAVAVLIVDRGAAEVGAVALAVVVVAVLGSGSLPAASSAEADKYEATSVVRHLLPADTPVGAFNSGVYSFYLPNRVVDLDGVVNRAVIPYLRSRTLCTYLQRQGVSWVLDDAVSVSFLARFAPGARVVDRVDISARYRGTDPYPVSDPQVLVRIDTGSCRSG